MVGKLIKHELFSIARIGAIPAGIMVLLAILARIMIATSSISLAVIILMFYIFSVIATLIIGYLFGIQSFYQSLFTGNGYLTLSLPVTADQLIWSKLISAITIMFASIIITILSALIFFIGLPAETLEAMYEGVSIMGDIIAEYVKIDALLVFETILMIIISIPMSFLVFYAVMSIGQLFTVKNRKHIAILLYVGLIFGWSILSQFAIEPIFELTTKVSIHFTMWLRIVFNAGITVGCYFIVRYIIRNKINLLV